MDTDHRTPTEYEYDYDRIPVGYYDAVFERHRGVQSKWHHHKFERFLAAVHPGERLCDVGSGPGTFIGLLPDTDQATGVDLAQPPPAPRNHAEYLPHEGLGRPVARLADDPRVLVLAGGA